MSTADHLPVEEKKNKSNPTKGGGSLKSPQEIPSQCDPGSRGNAVDLISSQPQPASQEVEVASGLKRPKCEPQSPTCPRCGLTVPDRSRRLQGSSLSVHSSISNNSSSSRKKTNRSRSSVASSHQPAATTSDSCFQLLLACLSCQCSVLILGLLESCSSCLYSVCSSCCHACSQCCSAVQEAPVEEFNCNAHCHSVLFQSCCEPTECLEFCLEFCDICHRS